MTGHVACSRCGKAYLPHHLDGMGECENCIPADEVAFANDLEKLDLGRLLDEDEALLPEDLQPMTPEQVAWVRKQRQ